VRRLVERFRCRCQRLNRQVDGPHADVCRALAAVRFDRVSLRGRTGFVIFIILVEPVDFLPFRLVCAAKLFDGLIDADHHSLPDRAIIHGRRRWLRVGKEFFLIQLIFGLEIAVTKALSRRAGPGACREERHGIPGRCNGFFFRSV
jgi:hypothetical protein